MGISEKFFKEDEIENINGLIQGMSEILELILNDYDYSSDEDRQLNRIKTLNMKLGSLDRKLNKNE